MIYATNKELLDKAYYYLINFIEELFNTIKKNSAELRKRIFTVQTNVLHTN